MAAEKALALVLRTIDFSETSVIVTLFTREFGKIGALAKGGRRLKGPFESALDLLALCRVVFLRKSSDALDLLTEAKLERRFRVSEAGLAGLNAAYYVAELLRELTHDNDPHPELFDAADATLAALGRSRGAPGHVVTQHVLRFEFTALRLLGHMPSLDACAECGAPIEPAGRVPFGHTSGGVLCAACRPGKRNVVSLSGPALAVLKQLAEVAPETEEAAAIERNVRGELRGLMKHYIAHLLGHELRTQGMLHEA
ncbi:MAG: DNA repair protein RecO [Planctomycetota bacterium]|nr:MAG: DNA repair protein RecO [Planctomycetota bacterium]